MRLTVSAPYLWCVLARGWDTSIYYVYMLETS